MEKCKIELEILESDYKIIERAYKKYINENKNSTHLMNFKEFIIRNIMDSTYDFMSD